MGLYELRTRSLLCSRAKRWGGVAGRHAIATEKAGGTPEAVLEKADSLLKPVMDSTAETLQRHGYGATVEMVRDQSGSDPNTFPYITLHFSGQRCAPSDLGYVYTLAGASITFICRRNELCVEVVAATQPAGAMSAELTFPHWTLVI